MLLARGSGVCHDSWPMRIDNVSTVHHDSDKSQLIWRCFSLKAIETYCNALINSNGGIVVFGVDHSGRGTIYDQNIKVYFMTTMNSAIIYSCRTSCRL